MAKVNYDQDNLDKCICSECPVEMSSQCSKKAQEKIRNSKNFPKPEVARKAGLYCAKEVGKSDCNDLADDEACLCSACPIWGENDLESSYYCLKGDADQVD
jgi:hypothetical protein